MMLLLPAFSQSTLDMVAQRQSAAPAVVSDSRRRRRVHPSVAATIRAQSIIAIDALMKWWNASAADYASRISVSDWYAEPFSPAESMVIESPSVWHSSHSKQEKHMVYAERNGVPVQPRTGSEALKVAASKLPARKTAEERTADSMKRAQDAFWQGFNAKQAEFAKQKESQNVGL